MLKLKLTRINEDGTEEHVSEELMKSVCILGECDDERLLELIANTSLANIGAMIMASDKMSKAAKLGVLADIFSQKLKKDMEEDPENSLLEQLKRGMQ